MHEAVDTRQVESIEELEAEVEVGIVRLVAQLGLVVVGVQVEADVVRGCRVRLVVLDQRVHETHKETRHKRVHAMRLVERVQCLHEEATQWRLGLLATATSLQILEQLLDTRSAEQLVVVAVLGGLLSCRIVRRLRLHDQTHGEDRAADALERLGIVRRLTLALILAFVVVVCVAAAETKGGESLGDGEERLAGRGRVHLELVEEQSEDEIARLLVGNHVRLDALEEHGHEESEKSLLALAAACSRRCRRCQLLHRLHERLGHEAEHEVEAVGALLLTCALLFLVVVVTCLVTFVVFACEQSERLVHKVSHEGEEGQVAVDVGGERGGGERHATPLILAQPAPQSQVRMRAGARVALQVEHLEGAHEIGRLVVGQHAHEQLAQVVGVHVVAVDEPLEHLVRRLEHEVGRQREQHATQLAAQLLVHALRLHGALERHRARVEERALERAERARVYLLELLEAVESQAVDGLAVHVGRLARIVQEGDAATLRYAREQRRLGHLQPLELQRQRCDWRCRLARAFAFALSSSAAATATASISCCFGHISNDVTRMDSRGMCILN